MSKKVIYTGGGGVSLQTFKRRTETCINDFQPIAVELFTKHGILRWARNMISNNVMYARGAGHCAQTLKFPHKYAQTISF